MVCMNLRIGIAAGAMVGIMTALPSPAWALAQKPPDGPAPCADHSMMADCHRMMRQHKGDDGMMADCHCHQMMHQHMTCHDPAG
ncbi:hypothetical protein GCM10020216_014520 [Nonomuraea helvata]